MHKNTRKNLSKYVQKMCKYIEIYDLRIFIRVLGGNSTLLRMRSPYKSQRAAKVVTLRRSAMATF